MSAWVKLGGFWKKISGKSGKKFLAGEIKCPKCEATTKITCWTNDKGDNPKRPDFVIYLSEDAPARAPKPEYSDADDSAFPDNDVPF